MCARDAVAEGLTGWWLHRRRTLSQTLYHCCLRSRAIRCENDNHNECTTIKCLRCSFYFVCPSLSLSFSLLVELPRLPAHRTLLRQHLRVQPLDDAVHVEAVRAGAPDKRTVVAGQRTLRAAALEGHATDAAVVVVCDPAPGGHGHPVCTTRTVLDRW